MCVSEYMCMYVCMYMCACICHACMYVCMYVCMHMYVASLQTSAITDRQTSVLVPLIS